MAEELGDRTEQPTGRRLGEARQEGQVARSQDLASAVDLIGAVLLIGLFGSWAIASLAVLMRRTLEGQVAGDALNPASIKSLALFAAVQGGRVVVPALLGMFLIACLAHVFQVGWHITTAPLRPNFGRLNPAGGFKKFFNLRALIKTGVNTVKLAIVAGVATLILRKRLPEIAALPMLGTLQGLYKMAQMGLELAVWLLAILLILGIVDYAYQKWQHLHDLRMTKQEVKDERKMTEGDPEVKARRMRMARDIAMQRIQHAVPKADVIVTNPTHFSVAIKYDSATMRAPRVIAKGADELALKIRTIAIASGIPMVERPPLARGLYWGIKVGQEISPEFYEAVAEVLAYVYRLEGRAA